MFSLFVTFQASDQQDGIFDLDKSRFLEYTAEAIAEQLSGLTVEAMSTLMSWPCLLMEEGRGTEQAYVGKIVKFEAEGTSLRITFVPFATGAPIQNDDIWRVRNQLGIQQFEFSRNHFAVKDADLLATLTEAGIEFEASEISCLEDSALPLPGRADLIRAVRRIEAWSHRDLDEFLLAAGVTGLKAGRDIGSRKDRCAAILEFAINNPTAVTADNRYFASEIVRASGAESYIDFLESASDQPEKDTEKTVEASAAAERVPNRVFVVHGRNEPARTSVATYLQELGLEPIVLHEQPNMGRHLLTKFIDEAELVTFATVLMTDDDVGGEEEGSLRPRARQNVILELGYFLAHLGQPRVCALITPGLETPSDFDGIVYIRMGEDGSWKSELKRELKAAELPVVD